MFRSPNSIQNKARTQFLNKQRMLSKVGSSSFSIVIACTFLVTTAPFDVRNISKTNAPVRFILYYLLFSGHLLLPVPFFRCKKHLKKHFSVLYTLYIFCVDIISCFCVTKVVDPYASLDYPG
jgi:hypothetical protein